MNSYGSGVYIIFDMMDLILLPLLVISLFRMVFCAPVPGLIFHDALLLPDSSHQPSSLATAKSPR